MSPMHQFGLGVLGAGQPAYRWNGLFEGGDQLDFPCWVKKIQEDGYFWMGRASLVIPLMSAVVDHSQVLDGN